MRKYVFVSKGQTCDNYGRRYDLFIGFSDSINNEHFSQKGKCYSYNDFEDFIKKKKVTSDLPEDLSKQLPSIEDIQKHIANEQDGKSKYERVGVI